MRHFILCVYLEAYKMSVVSTSWYFLIPRRLYLFMRCILSILLLIFESFCHYHNKTVWLQTVIGETTILILFVTFLISRFAGANFRILIRISFFARFFLTPVNLLNNKTEDSVYYIILIFNFISFFMDHDLWIRYGPYFNTYRKINLRELLNEDYESISV